MGGFRVIQAMPSNLRPRPPLPDKPNRYPISRTRDNASPARRSAPKSKGGLP